MSEAKRKLNPALVLTLIAVIATLMLAVVNGITEGPIAAHNQKQLEAQFKGIMPVPDGGQYIQEKGYTLPEGVSSLYAATDAAGNKIGYCVTASQKGYGGQVSVTFSVDMEGNVIGAAIGVPSETAGFGSRAGEASFAEQFAGMSAVDGGTFVPLSGATVTSKAVRGAANKALSFMATVLGKGPKEGDIVSFGEKVVDGLSADSVRAGATMQGTAAGWQQAEITVTYTLGDDKTITKVRVDASSQTPGFGQRCVEDEGFLNGIVGQTLPVTVDVLSGATFTSKAVEEAINTAVEIEPEAEAGVDLSAAKVLTNDYAVVVGDLEGYTVVALPDYVNGDVTVTLTAKDGKVTGAKVEKPETPAVVGSKQKAQVAGFSGEPVMVTVGLAADGSIASIKVDASTQTQGIGTNCQKTAFTYQFIGKKGPFVLGENGIDAVSGATVTSQAVVDALNTIEYKTSLVAVGKTQKQQVAGFSGEPVQVKVGLTADGLIASLKVDASTQTEGFGTNCGKEAFTSQFLGKKGPFTLGEGGIDAVSGATITSQAVVDALNLINYEGAASIANESAAPVASENKKASAPGFSGEPVQVKVGLAADGTIATLKVDASTQTEGFGTNCGKEDFTSKFIGKKGPFTLGQDGIDAVSGATITSQAVVDALNSLYQ